ncbi:MAG: hypothetical protein IRY92_00545 [Dactylosporangium sp.]|nr:hypothetical protein [Dactylosporangium sp.]
MTTPGEDEDLSDAWDAIAAGFAARMADHGLLTKALSQVTPADRAEFEAAIARHAVARLYRRDRPEPVDDD